MKQPCQGGDRLGPDSQFRPVEFQDTMLAAALEYAAAGLPVFPCTTLHVEAALDRALS